MSSQFFGIKLQKYSLIRNKKHFEILNKIWLRARSITSRSEKLKTTKICPFVWFLKHFTHVKEKLTFLLLRVFKTNISPENSTLIFSFHDLKISALLLFEETKIYLIRVQDFKSFICFTLYIKIYLNRHFCFALLSVVPLSHYYYYYFK